MATDFATGFNYYTTCVGLTQKNLLCWNEIIYYQDVNLHLQNLINKAGLTGKEVSHINSLRKLLQTHIFREMFLSRRFEPCQIIQMDRCLMEFNVINTISSTNSHWTRTEICWLIFHRNVRVPKYWLGYFFYFFS